jgi:hypothetical protein
VRIKISNPNLSGVERTFLTSDYSSGTSLTVRNSEGFTTNWFAIVGEPGQERTEAKYVTGLTNSITIAITSALSFGHPKSTPVYLSQWDKVAFERKASGGSFTAISGSPFSIEWDDQDNTTTIIVTGGETTDTYRWRFYNSSQLGTYSDYSDNLAGTGLDSFQVGYILKQIKRNPAAADTRDEVLIDFLNDYQRDIIYPELPKAWWFTKTGTQVATAVDTSSYSISTNWSDFRAMKYMLFRYINGSIDNTYPLTFITPVEYQNLISDANRPSEDSAKYWTLLPPDSSSALGYIGIHPPTETDDCYLKPVYYFELTDLDSFGDSIVVPYPKGYIDYGLYRVFDDIKGDTGTADKYSARVARSIVYLKRLNRRQLGQPELFRFRGQKGFLKQYGGEAAGLSSSDLKELYW